MERRERDQQGWTVQGSQDRSGYGKEARGGQATRSVSLPCVTQACILIPLDAVPQGTPLGLRGSLLTTGTVSR